MSKRNRYEAVHKAMRKGLRLRYLLEAAKVSRSGFYYWMHHRLDKIKRDKLSYELIKEIFNARHRKVGIRQIAMILLRKHKLVMNLKKIGRIKREYGLSTEIRRKNRYAIFVRRLQENKIAPNRLNRKFDQHEPDRVYSTDISYLPYSGGRAYLSATKDLASKEIVAFKVSRCLDMDIGVEELRQRFGLLGRESCEKLMIHSDQGIHYTSAYYSNELARHGVVQSMSRKGNCLDNAPIESFFGHLKDEIDLRSCQSVAEVRDMVTNFVHYYNNERMQWGLNKMTPAEYRSHLLKAI